MIGGTIAGMYGWRVAMLSIGMPGIVLAVIIRLFVIEPTRGLSDAQIVVDREPMPSAASAFAAMWRSGPVFHLVMGVTLTSLIGYALSAFGPSYLQRSLGMSVRQVALIVAPLAALFGTISGIGGGRIADWASRRWGVHAQSWLVALLKVASLPFTFLFCLTHDATVAIVAYCCWLLFASSYLGPTFALIQGLAPVRVRAMWAAVTLLVINLVGLGLGPMLIGVLSDALKPHAGAESLRWAMVIMASVTPWATFHYWRAGVLLKRHAAPAA